MIEKIHLPICKGCKWDYFEFSEEQDDACWYCSRSYCEDTEQHKTLPDLYQ